MKKLLTAMMLLAMLAWSCDDDDGGTLPPDAENFTVTIENVSENKLFSSSGIFDTPVGSQDPGPIGPGDEYAFTVKAGKGDRLSFVTMFAESNDLFYAPSDDGIELFDASGDPISGDVTDQIMLWDAGTEVNEEPGAGPNQAPRQPSPGTGDAESGFVMPVSEVNDGFTYPAVQEVIRVTVASLNDNLFAVTLENVSTASTLNTSQGTKPVPLSPGGWVVHSSDDPLFTNGAAARVNGLETIAEDGDASTFEGFGSQNSGLVYSLSPGVWAVHDGGRPIFEEGSPDEGDGLEALAEDGDPEDLADFLIGHTDVQTSGAFEIPVGESAPGLIGPGDRFEFSFAAEPGDRLSIATMFAQSNDLFYAFGSDGLDLFNLDIPVEGDVTSELTLYDAGTEVNEEPGFGPNQAPRQDNPATGTDENNDVEPVDDVFTYPPASSVVKVTISAN